MKVEERSKSKGERMAQKEEEKERKSERDAEWRECGVAWKWMRTVRCNSNWKTRTRQRDGEGTDRWN